MPDLHEQVETLERRGMKPHPRLRRHAPDLPDWEILEAEDADWQYIHADDARDLITMHALRWLFAAPGRMPWCNTSSVRADAVTIYEDACNIGRRDGDGYHTAALASTVLDAILAATAHMEPTHA